MEELEDRYNKICEAAIVKIYVKTQDLVDAENGVVPLKNFDFRNDEHRFVLSAARALGGIKGVQVAVDTNFVRLWWENRKIKVEGSLDEPKKSFKKDEISLVTGKHVSSYKAEIRARKRGGKVYRDAKRRAGEVVKKAAREGLERQNEVIADKFAGIYGYAVEISSALSKPARYIS